MRRRYSAVHRLDKKVLPLTCLFLPVLTEKLAEAQRRFTTLRTELQSTLDAQKEASGASTQQRRKKPVFHLSHEERVQHRNIKDLKLAFSELYLSLILLQNYQVPTRGGALVCVCVSVLALPSLASFKSVFGFIMALGSLDNVKERGNP